MKFSVDATGHENVRATHASTWEVTTDDFLTPAGDCILAIEADSAPSDVPRAFVDACRDADATITARFEAAGHADVVTGTGHPDLEFTNERGFVGRTSDYVDDRTVMVNADKAAADLDRDLVAALAEGARLTLTMRVE
jgi:hypothetical protein